MVNAAALFAIVLSTVGAQPRGEVIDFSLVYCGPCQQMAPIVEKLAREGHPIRKVDGQQQPQLAEQYGVTRYPTFVLVVDGKVQQRRSGLMSEGELRSWLDQIPRTEVATSPVVNPGQRPAAPPAQPGNMSLASNAVAPPGPFRSVLGEAAPLPRPQVREAAAPKAPAEPAAGLADNLWPFSRKKAAPEVRGSSEELPGGAVAAQQPSGPEALMATNARLRVRVGDHVNLGSGTLIESKQGVALIMTCGHIFRGANEETKIEVHLAPWERPTTLVGRLVAFDIDSDVGLVAISTDAVLPTVPVARRSVAPKVGDQMVCVGCSGGANPTREQIRVTAIDKYEGPSTIECTGLPVQGRSGGGLFDAQNRLVGICINADPEGQRGIYAGLTAIQDLLTKNHLAYLCQESDTRLAAAEPAAPKAAPAAPPAGDFGDSNPFSSRERSQPLETAGVQAAPAAPARSAAAESARDFAFSGGTGRPLDVSSDDAEVVVIIRQKGKPESANRVILIHEASPKFFQYLQGELAPGAAEGLGPSAATRVRRPVDGLAPAPISAGTSLAAVPAAPAASDVRTSKAGLQPTGLSQEFEPRPFIRKK